ncbi:MAG: sugar ABC transporter permease [Propionibacteriaceae bacterium]|nr:sugar ABC transporter permease [Propionibacteriaceae bacterium]
MGTLTMRPHRRRRSLVGLVLVAPVLLVVGVFFYVPAALSLYWSFTKYNGNTPPQFVGLKNYAFVLTDPQTLNAFGHTVVFALLSMTVGPLLGLVSALLLNLPIRGRVWFRNAFFLPVVMPLVVAGTIWKMLLADNGLINQLLGVVGLDHQWLTDPGTALYAIIATSVWQGFGFETVVFLSALQSIPFELYEAARCDGANSWHQFWAVTLPALRPTMVFVFVVGVIGAFQAYDQVYVMTQGGPLRSTETIVFLLVERFHELKLGPASAIAYLLVAVLATLSALQLRLGKEKA